MASLREITVVVKFANKEALEAFLQARELVREAAADHPWRDDLQEAKQLLWTAGQGLRLQGKD